MRWSGHCCIFAPTIEEESDDAIVTVHPLTAIKQRLFRDIPAIIGVTKDEGLMKSIGKFRLAKVTTNLVFNFIDNFLYSNKHFFAISTISSRSLRKRQRALSVFLGSSFSFRITTSFFAVFHLFDEEQQSPTLFRIFFVSDRHK